MSKQRDTVQIVINDVPGDLAEKIAIIAKREGRSRAAQLRIELERIVRERETKETPAISKAA